MVGDFFAQPRNAHAEKKPSGRQRIERRNLFGRDDRIALRDERNPGTQDERIGGDRRDGRIDLRNVRRCGLTIADLDVPLRQHGLLTADNVHLAIFEAKGAISVLPIDRPPIQQLNHADDSPPDAQRTADTANAVSQGRPEV